jgi:hypothetical protein
MGQTGAQGRYYEDSAAGLPRFSDAAKLEGFI